MKRCLKIMAVLTGLSGVAFASVITHGSTSVTMDFVTIGAPGNTGDPATAGGYGAVSYSYNIGKYQLTQGQYDTIRAVSGSPLTAGSSLGASTPVTLVSWTEVAMLCNWLTTGDFYTGVYTISGGAVTGVMDHQTAASTYGKAYAMPTLDEWHKAAYYSVTGGTYSIYATGLNTKPATNKVTGENIGTGSSVWNVGEGVLEQNGTYDMGGNVAEFTETALGTNRVTRSAYFGWGNDGESTVSIGGKGELYENAGYGFRIVEIVPEPASMTLVGAGTLMVILLRRVRMRA